MESFRDWDAIAIGGSGQDNTCNKRFNWKLGDLPKGYDHKYIYSHLGYNLKITDMQAAVGVAQLEHLDDFIAARRRNFARLREASLISKISSCCRRPRPAPILHGSDSPSRCARTRPSIVMACCSNSRPRISGRGCCLAAISCVSPT